MEPILKYLCSAAKEAVIASFSALYSAADVLISKKQSGSEQSSYNFESIEKYFQDVKDAMFDIGVLPDSLEDKLK